MKTFENLRPIDFRSSARDHHAKIARIRTYAATKPFRPPWECPNDQHYTIRNGNEAYWRVLYSNPTTDDRSSSAVGQTGHIERASAWTHLIASLICIIYAFVRCAVLDMTSLAAQLSGAAIVMSSITFGISTTYHVYSPVIGCAATMRNLDISAIYISLAMATVADMSLATNDFASVPFQSVSDPFLAAGVLVLYFTVRRFAVPTDETREEVFPDACSIGLYRFNHNDLEHAGLRIAGVSGITYTWIQFAPAVFTNLSPDVATVWIASITLSTMLIASGALFDTLFLPEAAISNGQDTCLGGLCTACSSKQLGCVMTSHAWWHVLSFSSVALLTFSREYGISQKV